MGQPAGKLILCRNSAASPGDDDEFVAALADATGIVQVGFSGSITIGSLEGETAHDAAASGTKPVLVGGYSSAAAPTSVNADGDATNLWMLRNGSPVCNLAAGGTLILAGAGTAAGALRHTLASDDPAVTALELIDDTIFTDDAAFTPATSKVQAVGFQADETATDSVDEGDIGCPRMTLDRRMRVASKALEGPGEPTIDSYTSDDIAANANTANQALIAAPGENKQIWVYGINFTVGTGDGSVSFQDEDDAAITGIMPFAQNGGMAVSPSGNFAMPLWKLPTNKALEVDTVTCDIKGSIQYAIVSV